MKLKVTRVHFLDKCTIGNLSIDGEDTGYFTLEPKVQSPKIFGETAIPVGTYKVIIDYSPHFLKNLPLLVDVPEFDGVRIHPGNTEADTEGCVLVGETWNGSDFIGDSRAAFEVVFDKIKSADEVTIEIA
jgi:hypothetical protein